MHFLLLYKEVFFEFRCLIVLNSLIITYEWPDKSTLCYAKYAMLDIDNDIQNL